MTFSEISHASSHVNVTGICEIFNNAFLNAPFTYFLEKPYPEPNKSPFMRKLEQEKKNEWMSLLVQVLYWADILRTQNGNKACWENRNSRRHVYIYVCVYIVLYMIYDLKYIFKIICSTIFTIT